jgi:hypothetical protein
MDYPRVIKESQEELKWLEERHRYSHLFHRVKMLRLLKSKESVAIWGKRRRLWAIAGVSATDGLLDYRKVVPWVSAGAGPPTR